VSWRTLIVSPNGVRNCDGCAHRQAFLAAAALAVSLLACARADAECIELPLSGPAVESAAVGVKDMVKQAQALQARADLALYEAKKQDRNLVRVADESLQASPTAIRRALRARG
jgi:hypothetical protein